MSKERLEAFSDAVFAVALTLLVLELRVPDVAARSNLSQYAAAVAPLIPKAISFVLTFALICIHWVSHHLINLVCVGERVLVPGLFSCRPVALFCANGDFKMA